MQLTLFIFCQQANAAYIDDDAGVFLAKALAENKVLVNLNLASNMLGPKSARALGDMLVATSTIKQLNLEGNPLSVVQLHSSDGDASGAAAISSKIMGTGGYLDDDGSATLASPNSGSC